MAHTATPTFDLPVAATSFENQWISPDLARRIKDSLEATNHICRAIILQAPLNNMSRPTEISFLLQEPDGVTIKRPCDLSENHLLALAPAALLLENDLLSSRIFDSVNNACPRAKNGKFHHVAVTGHAALGWHRSYLVTSERKDKSLFTQGEIIAAALCSNEHPNSSHWAISAQAELGDLASLIYDFEVGKLSNYYMSDYYRSAKFKVVPTPSRFI